MRLESLARLHKSMIAQKIDMQQFKITVGVASFDCLFSVRETPFILSLTSRGINPKFFMFEVHEGYRIKEYFEKEMYYELLTVLKIDGRSGKKLIPKDFLSEIDRLIPTIANHKKIPSSEMILSLRHDLEERDKPYFDTWIPWDKASGRSPSTENLKKTMLLLGIEAYSYSKKMNASSRWSATPMDKTWKNNIT